MSDSSLKNPNLVVLMAHPGVVGDRKQVADAARTAIAAARKAGVELFANSDEIGALVGLETLDDERRPDLCLAFGGDGTILRGLRRFGPAGIPVFGVNYGVTGFLTAAEPAELEDALEAAFAGGYEITNVPGLAVEVDGGERLALNDVTFARRPDHRVAELAYRLGGKEVGHVRCDGLVAATPTGSTGYNLANGGPILAWGVQGYVVSFIAPHTLTARALVVAPEDSLAVRNEGRDSVIVSFDGEAIGELEPDQETIMSFRASAACLAQLPGENFYLRIREKFGRLAR